MRGVSDPDALDLLVLGMLVAGVALQRHGFVIAQQQLRAAAHRPRLLGQAVDRPQDLGLLRAAVEHIAGNQQRTLAVAPLALRVDDVVGTQQEQKLACLAVEGAVRGPPCGPGTEL